MFKEIEIESNFELPYKLIDINERNEHFVFEFKCFDNKQTDYSVQAGGVTGRFEVIYTCRGIESQFECDITIGNVYEFYNELKGAYKDINGKDLSVCLKNYGEVLKRSRLVIDFDKLGHCILSGNFKNKDNYYKCGIDFEIEIDQTYILNFLGALEAFFNELKRIQGHCNFY